MKILKQYIHLSRKQHARKQQGVTLVELMIAITISSIVAIGISSVYTSSKRSYKLQEEFSRLQENGRFAINHITRFVRSAGYSGCASGLDNINSIMNDSDDDIWEFATGIEGYEFVGASYVSPGGTSETGPGELKSLPATVTATADSSANHDLWKTAGDLSLPDPTGSTDLLGNAASPILNTDILISRTADGSGIEVSRDHNSGNVFVACPTGTTERTCADGSSSGCGLCIDDPVLVSDCQNADAFQITNVTQTGNPPSGMTEFNVVHAETGTPGNSTPILDRKLNQGDEVMRISTKVFYIGKGTNGPSLFMRQGSSIAVELVEGVESMQVLYGEDTDATPDNIPNRYVAANDVLDFANVVAVRVSILLRSVKELPWRTASKKIYLLGGMDNDTAVRLESPSDKRLRKVMSTTIKVRNRAFTL